VLELYDVSLLVATAPQELVLLGDVSAAFSPGELVAVVGSPGSGKSTLLKLLAGVCHPTFGKIRWRQGVPVRAYLPSMPPGVAADWGCLSLSEHVETALRLRVAGLSPAETREQTAALLEKTGLAALADQRPGALTCAQRRRLALVVELTGSPQVLLCDEPGGAFDPQTDLELARLLRSLAREEARTIFNVTPALGTLEVYDTVVVLHGGQLAYVGPPEFLDFYFQLGSTAELYTQLATRRPDDWHRSWSKHRQAYQSEKGQVEIAGAIASGKTRLFLEKLQARADAPRPAPPSKAPRPGFCSQCVTLLGRRFRLAGRDFPALWRTVVLALGLPLAVAVFAAKDLGWLREFSLKLTGNVVELLQDDAVFAVQASHASSLIAGLALAQVLLLAFLAVHNAAREIAGERMTFEIEKYRGLRAGAYLASKIIFLLPLVLAQAAWMGFYVNSVCGLPGSPVAQIGVLALVNAAFTALCLAVSSLTRAPWRALLICLGLAALQLPFSGAVLAPPEALTWIARPLVTLYWGASAYLQTMEGSRFHEVFQIVAPLSLSPRLLCLLILASHVILGLTISVAGCKIARLGLTRKHPGT
jgi:ABC-type glutathione transport system ATPase component